MADREKPSDSSMLVLAADVKLRVDVIFPLPTADDDSRLTESRRGELVDVESFACVV